MSVFDDEARVLMADTGVACSWHGGPTGAPVVNGATTAGATTLVLEVLTGTLTGYALAGAQFTVANEAGSPTHTVTDTKAASSNAIAALPFTPAIAAGGVANHAAVTFATAHGATGILQREAAMISGQLEGENVYELPVLLLAADQATGLVAGDGVLVAGTPYAVRKTSRPEDGAVLTVLLASIS